MYEVSQTRPLSVQISSTPKHLTTILYLRLPKYIMKLRSKRISTRRRSSRLQSSRHILGRYQSPLEQRPADSLTSQLASATSSSFYPPQTHNPQTRKRRPDRSIEAGAERPPKRARLTEENLKAFEMGGRQRKSAGKKSAEQSSSTTTTTDKVLNRLGLKIIPSLLPRDFLPLFEHKDFGPQLQRNNVIFDNIDARAPDDINEVRELFNQPRESEPPDQLAYKRYLVTTQGYKNEATIQHSAYPLLAKRASAKRGISGYTQSANYACALAPTSYDIAMPAFAAEYKGYDSSMVEAQLQCAYDGALMTEGARAVHTYMDNSDDDFYGKTQAVTIAYNDDTVKFYGHHAVRIPASSQPAVVATVDSSVDATSDPLEYHQYVLTSDASRNSFENFQSAYKHIRNAQDIGYKWATERKDALWAYTNRDNTQIPPDVARSARKPLNDSWFLSPQVRQIVTAATPMTTEWSQLANYQENTR
ncbi:hypothetical protein B0O99DRAFT_591745 [Bisporella sp. PMI_857]|nr:hypothetical protein B0O99DRAFT_591745 [Bisporella sp. PMI_857]